MNRPESPELDAIFSTAEEIRATEARLIELKAQGSVRAQALATVEDKALRLAAAVVRTSASGRRTNVRF